MFKSDQLLFPFAFRLNEGVLEEEVKRAIVLEGIHRCLIAVLQLLLVEVESGSELAQFFSLDDGHPGLLAILMIRHHLCIHALHHVCLLRFHCGCHRLSNHRHAEEIHEGGGGLSPGLLRCGQVAIPAERGCH